MKSIYYAAVSIAVVGCSAVPLAQQEEALATKQVCCKDAEEFQYATLEKDKALKFVLDDQAPVFIFVRTKKSYFKAFELPQGQNRGIYVKSYFNGAFIGQYLQPIFQFYNANYAPLAALTPRQEFVRESLFGDNHAHMAGGVKVPDEAKYVAVFTAKFDTPVNPADTGPSTNVFMAGSIPVVTQSAGRKIELERAPTGGLSLQVVTIER